MVYAPYYQNPFPLRAGLGILKHYDVALDFDAHTACFLLAD